MHPSSHFAAVLPLPRPPTLSYRTNSLHSRWGSADNVPGASSFEAKRNSSPVVKTVLNRKAPDSSAAMIAAAASGTFVSKASSRKVSKSGATKTDLDTIADDKAAAQVLIADTALANWWLAATATSAG